MRARVQRQCAWQVHHVDGRELLGSRRGWLGRSVDGGLQWEKLLRLPTPSVGGLRSSHPLAARLLRGGVHHLIKPEPDFALLQIGRAFLGVDLRRRRIAFGPTPVAGSRPLRLCVDARGWIYYGEYRSNAERSAVAIHRSVDRGENFTPVQVFSDLRHVHAVQRDPYDGALWATTGDADHECGLWRSEDGFATVERIAGGTQQTRCIPLLFREDALLFGSDTPLERNRIYRMDRRSGAIEACAEVGGSVFHGLSAGGRHYLSTACEPSAVNRLRTAELWASDDGRHWQRLLALRKDRWPMKLFQYGQIRFAEGQSDADALWITPFATEHDQRSCLLKIEAAHSPEAILA